MLQPNHFHQVSQVEKNGSVIRVSDGEKSDFLIKTVLNGGIRAISCRKNAKIWL